jgi:hypothetical protein
VLPTLAIQVGHYVVRFAFFMVSCVVAATLDAVPFRSPHHKLVFVCLFLAYNVFIYVQITFAEPTHAQWFATIALPPSGFFDTQTMRSQTLLNLLAFVVKFAVALVQYPFTLIVLRAPIGAAVYVEEDDEDESESESENQNENEVHVSNVGIVKQASGVHGAESYDAIMSGGIGGNEGAESRDACIRMDSYRPPSVPRPTATD